MSRKELEQDEQAKGEQQQGPLGHIPLAKIDDDIGLRFNKKLCCGGPDEPLENLRIQGYKLSFWKGEEEWVNLKTTLSTAYARSLKVLLVPEEQDTSKINVSWSNFWQQFYSASVSKLTVVEDETDRKIEWVEIEKALYADHEVGNILYFRECYFDLWKSISFEFKKQCRSFCVIGTPGMGKSMFLLFLMKMNKDKPIVFHHFSYGIFTFQGNKCLEHNSIKDPLPSQLLMEKETLYLVDTVLPRRDGVDCIKILTVSLRDKIVKNFTKYTHKTLYMPPWRFYEIEDCAGLKRQNIETCRNQFHVFGGNARAIFQNSSWSTLELGDLISISQIKAGVVSITYLESNKISQYLLHMYPTQDYLRYETRFASDYVEMKFIENVSLDKQAQLLQFLSQAAQDPLFGSLRGNIWEAFVHQKMSLGGIYRVKKLEVDGNGNETELRLDNIYPVKVFKLGMPLERNTWHRPDKSNFESIDSVIPEIGLFQITVAKRHGIKQNGLVKILKELGDPSSVNFYFVLPPDVYHHYNKPLPYLAKHGLVSKAVPAKITKSVHQYALEFKESFVKAPEPEGMEEIED